jgi:hypothetical protein
MTKPNNGAMRRRTLLKLMALLPWFGPTIAKALTTAEPKPVRVYGPYLPPHFPKWDKTVDGLESAAAWSSSIERTRLPNDLIIPRVGEIWEAIRDCEVSFSLRRNEPYNPKPIKTITSVNFSLRRTEPYSPKLIKTIASASPAIAKLMLVGGKTQLRQGEQIRILGVDDPDKPLFVTFEPVRYEELLKAIVPEEMRRTVGNGAYELSLKTARTVAYIPKEDSQAYFNEAFRFVR